MDEQWGQILKVLVFFGGIISILVCMFKHEEVLGWIRSKFKKNRPEVDFQDWNRAKVRLALDFASNGVVIRAFSETKYGDMATVLNTRVAADMSDVGNQVMAILAEIELKK